ncbi:MAG TPA: aldolase/citrate lyase family protein [Rhizomicrobium sp.]|nr:aldolase/citrate lyase family protein [Rhizomicrobium sp.]
MKFSIFSVAAGLTVTAAAALAQTVPGQPTDFPLAAKEGVNSQAIKTAPPGAANQGAFDMNKWKYGHAFDAPPGTPIWNPVKVKMLQGGKITSASIAGNSDPAIYCAMANAGYDFIWTEMQHAPGTWDSVSKMWNSCPHAKAVPGARIPNANEFDEQHAMDMGALWLEVPTVRTVAEAQEAVKWAYYPPMGGRSLGGQPAALTDVPGGYRNTINDNLVLTVMIETLDGLRDADKIAAIPGISALFAASSDLGNFAGYKQGDPDYEREINIVHDAALASHKYLCGPYGWVNRPDFKCYQGPGNIIAGASGDLYAIYADAAKKALGPLWNTQGKPTAGPYAAGYVPKPAGRGAPTGG